MAESLNKGPGRVLVAIYGVFALSAGARASVQIASKFHEAPLAYSLSALAAVVYIVATVALARSTETSRRVAFAAVGFELLGVLAVGTASIIDSAAFPDATVWSDYGQGYGYVPLVLPLVGLFWLWRTSRKVLIDWSADARPLTPATSAAAPAAMPAMDPAQAELVKQQLLATGVPGVARVLSAEFTGALDQQGRPVYRLQLHVQVDGRAPFAGVVQVGVPLERVSVMQPGGTIPIKADRYDPTKFTADWERTPTA